MVFLLSHLLEESASRFPDKEAVHFKGMPCTYGELEEMANQTAHALRSAGVRRGDRIGIYLHKCTSSVISVFGIGKAGGVYVPLDPNAPLRRIAYIIQNCGISVILTSTTKLGQLVRLAEDTPLNAALLMDSGSDDAGCYLSSLRIVPWEEIRAEKTTVPVTETTVDSDLAYILYTSGSTGLPKGVMISHRTIFAFIDWCSDMFRMASNDRVTSHAPLHFDLSTFDIFVTVKSGGTIIVVPEQLSVFPIQLVRLLVDERVTVTYLVPSILAMMVNYGRLADHDLSALRALLFAGEVLPIKYLRRLAQATPNAEYYNLYGPTETNVCTYYKVGSNDLSPDRVQPLPIGKACENADVFALDSHGELIKQPGQEGELWVRGPCVALGYWGDKEKSSRVFVQNPFQQHFQEPVYRTGDIVALDEDGANWHYVGRRDHMIKSRGHRVELGEIECILNSHEAITEAAAVAVPDDIVGNRIKAYVVLGQQAKQLSGKELQQYCGEYLPNYMVPEHIEIREMLPKTSSGKIDRQTLVQA